MAEVGQEIRNPRQRERIVFRRTAGEMGGRLLRLEMFAAPGGAAPPEHLHPRQEERFETVSGVLRARVGGQERDLRAGQSMVVPLAFPTPGGSTVRRPPASWSSSGRP